MECEGQTARSLEPGEAGETVVMASYPRSGNTMLRKLIESATGVLTGSDSRPDRTMARDLKLYGLEGEGDVGDHRDGGRVWVVKSHFPEKYGWKELGAQRAILLVRNPFNAIRSYFNMLLTGTHTHSIIPSEYTRFADVWDSHVREEIGWWCEYHLWWLRQPIPVLVVRYEELVAARPQARERELRRIVDFLYGPTHTRRRMEAAGIGGDTDGLAAGVPRIEDTPREEVEARLRTTLEKAAQGSRSVDTAYKPRSAAVSTDVSHFTEEQQTYVVETAASVLSELGYADLLHADGLPLATPAEPTAPALSSQGGLPECPLVWCNRGPPMRPQTKEDPGARGFMWKWKLRKIVQVAAKPGSTEHQMAAAEAEVAAVSQEQVRLFEDDVVSKISAQS